METQLNAHGKMKLKSSACTLCSKLSPANEVTTEEPGQIRNVLGNRVPDVTRVLDETTVDKIMLCEDCDVLVKEAMRLHDLIETLNSQLISVLVSIKTKVIEKAQNVKGEPEDKGKEECRTTKTKSIEGHKKNRGESEAVKIKANAVTKVKKTKQRPLRPLGSKEPKVKAREERQRGQSSVTSEVEGFSGNEYFVFKDEADSHEESDDADETFSLSSTAKSSSFERSDVDTYEPPYKTRQTTKTKLTEDPKKNRGGSGAVKIITSATKTQKRLFRHQKSKKPKVEKREKSQSQMRRSKDFCCSWCSKYFRNMQDKFLHYESVHFKGAAEDVEGECRIYSRICGKSSMTPADLSRHNETFHDSSFRFRCSSCDKKFTSEGLLKAHKAIHSNFISFSCSLCVSSVAATFESPSELGNHIHRVHAHTIRISRDVHSNQVGPECSNSTLTYGRKPNFCRWCGSNMRGFFLLREHERQAHPERFTFVCENLYCQSTFAEESYVLTCQETHRDSPGPFKCFVCQITCHTASELKEHLAAKHTAGGVMCEECPALSSTKRFRDAFQLVAHKAVNHGGEWPHKCPLCQRGFRSPLLVKNHLRSVHKDSRDPVVPDPYECSDCGKKFANIRALHSHIQVEHKEQGNVVCKECGKILRTKKSLKYHMKIHKGQMNHVCHICGKGFVRSHDIKVHLQTHTKEKSYACTFCDRTFARPFTLKNHIQIHRGKKHQVCYFCGKGFVRSHDLNVHLRTHTREKSYACALCDKTFARSLPLRNHMKTHKRQKDYVCHICGKGFVRSEVLKVHLRTHTGEKPYACALCDKTFAQSSILKIHMKIHKGQKDHVCYFCGKGFVDPSGLTVHLRTHTGEKPCVCHICGNSRELYCLI